MSDHRHIDLSQLTRLSARLEELFHAFSSFEPEASAREVADDLAATAGELMLLLAGREGDGLVREALDDARRLREVARTLRPERTRIAEAGAALTHDVERIIREEKRAA